MKEKVLVSFSGGRTSGMMSYLIKTMYNDKYDLKFVFANTGKEDEATLKFVNQCDVEFGLDVVWVEAQVFHGQRKSSGHKVVDFTTASRNGEPFEETIKKYGIPNNKFKNCSRELKKNPIRSYLRSIGWGSCKNYKTVIGIRADEPKRINWENVKTQNFWYFLAEHNIKKIDVNNFWSKQKFDLELKSYEGNCDLCYKKSKRKLLTILKNNPARAEWWKNMEVKYESFTPGARTNINPPYRFYRDNESIEDLIEESKLPFEEAIDDSKEITNVNSLMNFNIDMDEQNECIDSCEPF
jgi:hypothetical protein